MMERSFREWVEFHPLAIIISGVAVLWFALMLVAVISYASGVLVVRFA